MQTCTLCETEKPESDFYVRKKSGQLYKGCKKCVSAKNSAYQTFNPNFRNNQLRYTYGITLYEYDEMLKTQGGKCAICHSQRATPNTNRRMFVDHDHKTGKVRGLLCLSCNTLVGQSSEKLDTLKRAVEYLERK